MPSAFNTEDLAPEGERSAFDKEDLLETSSAFDSEDLVEKSEETERGTSIPLSRIEEIAKKHGVSKEELVSLAPLYNASVEGTEGLGMEDVEQVAGFLSESVGMGVIPFLVKKLSDENKEAAMDELREEADARKSRLMQGTEIVAGIGSAVGLGRAAAKTAAKLVGAGAGAADKLKKAETAYDLASAVGGGATTGLTMSKQGEEAEGALTGAAMGLALGLGGTAISKALSKRAAKRAGEEVLEEVASKSKKLDPDEAAAEDVLEILDGEGGRNAVERAEKEYAREAVPEASRKEKVLSDEILPEDASLSVENMSQTRRDALLDPFKKQGLTTGNVSEPINVIDVPGDRARFANWLKYGELGTGSEFTPQTSLSVIKEKTREHGVPELSKLWDEFRKAEIAQDFLHKEVDEAAPAINQGAIQRLALKLLDGRQYAARLIDNKLGTRFANEIDKLSKSNNRYTNTVAAYHKQIKNLDKTFKELGTNQDSLYKYLDSGDATELSPAQLDVANKYKELMESARQRAADLGTFIDKRDHYVKHQMKDLPEVLHIFAKKFKDFSKQGFDVNKKGLTQEAYDELKSMPEGEELINSIAYFTGNQVPKDVETFTALARSILDVRKGGNRWATKAGAAFARTAEEVPALIRESNPITLAKSWVHNTFRHAYYHPHLSTVKLYRQMAKDAGDDAAEKYLTNWVQDMAGGVREGTFRKDVQDKMNRMRVGLLQRIDSPLTGPIAKAGYKALYAAPDFFPIISNQVYPNLLGWSPRAVLTNLVQPIMVAWPELGGAYGATRVASAYKNAAKTLMTGKKIQLKNPEVAEKYGKKVGDVIKTRNLALILENEGNIPTQWNDELAESLYKGIAESAPVKLSAAALTEVNKWGMDLYGKSETLNRFIANEMAESMTKDLLNADNGTKGHLSNGVKKFFGEVDKGYRDEFTKSLKSGNEAELKEKLTDYLIGKTVFNYNRASLNEFGRSVGPIVTTFTKWPMSVAGDMLLEMQKDPKKALPLLGRRYLAPLVLLHALDKAIDYDEEASDRTKALVGQDLTRFASAGAVGSILTGEVAKPPLFGAIAGLAEGAFSADPAALWKWANDVTQSFAPGAGLGRFLLQDVPALKENDRPKGKLLDLTIDAIEGEF